MKTSTITRLALGTAVAAMTFGNAGLASAQEEPAREATGDPTLLTKETAAITAGDTAWVALNWTTKKGAVDDLKITTESKDATVTYPENTADHSGPLNGYALEDGEVDFTALQVEVPYGTEKEVRVKVYASYTSEGKAERKKFEVKIPVATYDGSDAELLTDSLDITVGEQWVEVSYKGMAPLIDEFTVKATGPDGLYIEHARGDYSSLEGNAQLEDNETDVVRFFLDASDLEAGSYSLNLASTYTKGGDAGSLDGTVNLNVAPATS